MENIEKKTKKTNAEKNRAERWSQPLANAKIEDLASLNQFLLEQINNMNKNIVDFGFSHDVLAETLIQKGLITKEQLDNTAKSIKEKQEKFIEILTDKDLSAEEKNDLAKNSGIDFDFSKLNAE